MGYLKTRRFLLILFLTVTLAVACMATILVTRLWGQWRVHAQGDEECDAVAVQQEQESEAASAFVVRAHDEKIGVFDASGKLAYVVDVYLITLPQADRELLSRGIRVRDERELAALMEDYTG